uniref:(northern house mosquito) hypothetical protein n=1 Tax=Culex pipiens TaxID=7175 RepID=A0A8D8K157_CULPI
MSTSIVLPHTTHNLRSTRTPQKVAAGDFTTDSDDCSQTNADCLGAIVLWSTQPYAAIPESENDSLRAKLAKHEITSRNRRKRHEILRKKNAVRAKTKERELRCVLLDRLTSWFWLS